MTYTITEERNEFTGGYCVNVHADRILVTGRVWPHCNEVSFSVSQGGDPKARNLDTIIDMIKVADEEITKHLENGE